MAPPTGELAGSGHRQRPAHPSDSRRFTSPQFIASIFPLTGLQLNYSRVAFETDLPNVERSNTARRPAIR